MKLKFQTAPMVLALALSVAASTSCKKDSDDNDDPAPTPAAPATGDQPPVSQAKPVNGTVFPSIFKITPAFQMRNTVAIGNTSVESSLKLDAASAAVMATFASLDGLLRPEVELFYEVDAEGHDIEVRKFNGVEARQTYYDGIQRANIVRDGKKIFQFLRNTTTGEFRGIIVGKDAGGKAIQVATIITALGEGKAKQVFIADVEAQGEDVRGDVEVNTQTFVGQKFLNYTEFDGGLAAQPESAALITEFEGGF